MLLKALARGPFLLLHLIKLLEWELGEIHEIFKY